MIPSDKIPEPRYGYPIGEWHTWFAWFPIYTFDRRLAFLRFVKRRCIEKYDYLDGGAEFWWQYAFNEHVNPKRTDPKPKDANK
jgi:hypothetical protein